ncbi:MAG: hypothetical protein ACLS4Y_02320 [Faecalibacterium sp.]
MELFLVFFQTLKRFLTSFSILFNFQGPVRLSLAADDLFILPPKWFFVKPYFLEAFELSELGHFKKFLRTNWNFSASIGSFQGLPAEASEVILLPQRLALKYNTTPPPPCQHFLTDFFQFLCRVRRISLFFTRYRTAFFLDKAADRTYYGVIPQYPV